MGKEEKRRRKRWGRMNRGGERGGGRGGEGRKEKEQIISSFSVLDFWTRHV